MSTQQDWNKYFQERQHLDEHIIQPNPFVEVYNWNPQQRELWFTRERFQQLKVATGLGTCAFLTKVGFAYLGGMYQARRQFINSPFYFRNHYYNWLRGSKYITLGFLAGTLLSTFAFGYPYLLEDYIRSKFRNLTTVQFVERGYMPM
jgi:hypothetical protein